MPTLYTVEIKVSSCYYVEIEKKVSAIPLHLCNTFTIFIIIQYRRFTLFLFPNQLISIITFLSTRSSLSHHNDYCYHLPSIDTLYFMRKYVEVVDATRRSINVIGYMKDTIHILYISSFWYFQYFCNNKNAVFALNAF